jgi:hypothetical protein
MITSRHQISNLWKCHSIYLQQTGLSGIPVHANICILDSPGASHIHVQDYSAWHAFPFDPVNPPISIFNLYRWLAVTRLFVIAGDQGRRKFQLGVASCVPWDPMTCQYVRVSGHQVQRRRGTHSLCCINCTRYIDWPS